MFLFIVLLSTWIGLVPTIQATTVTTSTKSVSTNQQPVQTTMPQTIKFKDLDITITTTPLSYAEVVALVPDLQENFFSSFFKTKEHLFNSRYQALKLELSNQSSTHYFFQPKQTNLPLVTLEKIRSETDNSYGTTLSKILLGAGGLLGAVLCLQSGWGLALYTLVPFYCAFSIVISNILSSTKHRISSLLCEIFVTAGVFLVLASLLIVPCSYLLMGAITAAACHHPLVVESLVCFSLVLISIGTICYASVKAGSYTVDFMEKSATQPMHNSIRDTAFLELDKSLIISPKSNRISLVILEKQRTRSPLIFALENGNTECRDVAIECPWY